MTDPDHIMPPIPQEQGALVDVAPDMLAALHNASWLLADLSPDGLVKKQIDEVIARAVSEGNASYIQGPTIQEPGPLESGEGE